MSTPAAPAATASDHLPADTTIGDGYTLTAHIGRGGVGDVYRAKDAAGAVVAVKVLDLKRLNIPPSERARLLRRFEREASAAARIEHPNVITIHASGIDAALGCPYMVMELLDGHDLREELTARRAIAPDRAIALTRVALDALAAAHALGIVHKDLKPANLFLTDPGGPDERLHLLDFGVAHIAHDERLTQAGQIACTPNYAAPEYVTHHDVSPSYDVYQVGLILVEMFTGRPVVDLASAGLCLAAHAAGRLELPAPLLEGPLGPLLRRALALEPAARFPDAAAMRDALDALDLTGLAPLPPRSPRRPLGASGDAITRPALSNELEPLLRNPPPQASQRPTAIVDAKDSIVVDQVERPTLDPTATVKLSDVRSQRLKSLLEVERRATAAAAPEDPHTQPTREATSIEVTQEDTPVEEVAAPRPQALVSHARHAAIQPTSGGPVWLLATALVGLVLLGSYPCLSIAALALVRSVEARSADEAPDDKETGEETGEDEASGKDTPRKSKEAR